ncbi:MAG TPA: hypothetical protein VJI46_06445 [Candidatus Nanoarchaeia archaeon]|nr:hypothetical protein [Candidatus Nanoarchaeia archaeon]
MALRKSLKITMYQKALRKLLDKSIVDIIIFGSLSKGGTPRDVDIAVVVREIAGASNVKSRVRSIIQDADVHLVSIDSIYSPLWLSLMKEGFSVKKNCYLHEIYGIKPVVLYKYSLTKLTNVQKVQFERGLKNVLGKEGTYLTRSVILVPVQIKNSIEDFLKTWSIYYESQVYELIPFMRKEEFI